MILKIAPVGVFSLVLAQFSIYGMVLIKPLVGYFLTVLGVLFLHVLVVHYQIIKRLTVFKFNAFLSEMRPVLLFAFATASSAATIPLTMKTLTQKLNISSTSTSFVVPLGATLNMDGTAIMQGVATVLIANLYHIPLTLFDHISIVGLATLASIGAAGIPSAGMITLAMILQQIGLPVEGIAMIIGIDRILDMVRTSVNVFGDACICAAIDHLNHSKKKSPTIR